MMKIFIDYIQKKNLEKIYNYSQKFTGFNENVLKNINFYGIQFYDHTMKVDVF